MYSIHEQCSYVQNSPRKKWQEQKIDENHPIGLEVQIIVMTIIASTRLRGPQSDSAIVSLESVLSERISTFSSLVVLIVVISLPFSQPLLLTWLLMDVDHCERILEESLPLIVLPFLV